MVLRAARWLPAILWMALLYYLSDQPRLIIDDLPIPALFHTLSHIGAYVALGWLLSFGTGWSRTGLWIAFLLAAGYGAFDEFHQSFVPDRGAHLWQIGLDAAAAGAALLFLHLARQVRAAPRWLTSRSGSRGR